MYDPAIERRDVAIRSMYRMWHGRLRDELLRLLPKDLAATAFADQPFPRTERDVFAVIRRCHPVAAAAERLLADYVFLNWEERRDYYNGDDNGKSTQGAGLRPRKPSGEQGAEAWPESEQAADVWDAQGVPERCGC